jgi:transposase
MTESEIKQLASKLVVGRKRDGRCIYDEAVKREVVEICGKPGVSTARMALHLGVNANVLRTWITGRRRRVSSVQVKPMAPPETSANAPLQIGSATPGQLIGRAEVAPASQTNSAFMAGVRILNAQSLANCGLQVHLPNGVRIDVQPANHEDLACVVRVLAGVSCSESTSR